MRILWLVVLTCAACREPVTTPPPWCSRVADAYCTRCLPALAAARPGSDIEPPSHEQCVRITAGGCAAATAGAAPPEPGRLDRCLRAFASWDCSGYAPPACGAGVTTR